jgi:tripartite-type tricarboxylate transporter receptor subunit TctC
MRQISRKGMVSILAILFIVTFVNTGYTAPPKTKAAADFYKGKRIEWYVPSKAGGGYDTATRAIAPYMEKHTGARILVMNKPGGGMMLSTKYVYSATKPDGLSLGMVQTLSAALYELLQRKSGEELDITKFNWLGSVAAESLCLYINSKLPYKSLAELQKAKEIKFGITGPYGTPAVVSRLLMQEALGMNVKPILGIEASPAVTLAVVRGEYDATSLPARGIVRHVKEGLVRPLVILAKKRFKQLPDVPTIFEALKGWDLSEENKFWVDRVITFNELYRTVVTTPGVPQDRVAFLRQALMQCFQDQELFKQGEKLMIEFDYVSGEEVAKEMEVFVKMNPKRMARFKELMTF